MTPTTAPGNGGVWSGPNTAMIPPDVPLTAFDHGPSLDDTIQEESISMSGSALHRVIAGWMLAESLEVLGTPGIPELVAGSPFAGVPALRDVLPGVSEQAFRLRESSFLRGLTAAMLVEGAHPCEICRMYALHQPGDECPAWGPDAACPPCGPDEVEVGGFCVPACVTPCAEEADCEGLPNNPVCVDQCCRVIIP